MQREKMKDILAQMKSSTAYNTFLRRQLQLEYKKNDSILDSSGLSCIMCCASERNCIFIGCNHVCVCNACAKKINNTCPICRKKSDIKTCYLV